VFRHVRHDPVLHELKRLDDEYSAEPAIARDRFYPRKQVGRQHATVLQ
jgi:hypothetical protein